MRRSTAESFDGEVGRGQPPILRIEGVQKRFGATRALDGVDFEVRPGEVHALIGENGAGKSTLMNLLAGSLRPDSGAMRLAGLPYLPASPLDARRAGVALIHQELSLCPHLTVTENILLGAESAHLGWLDRDACRARAMDVLRNFEHPEIRPERRVGDLSIPAQQVVEICRALNANARVVLMDEPTSSLQRADVERLFSLIRRLRADGIAVVYISHFLEEVREIADRYTVLRDGKSVDSGELAAVTNERLVTQMVGRSMSGLYPARPRREPGPVALDVRGLAAPPLLKDASFTLRSGEILGVAGLMGSGRTEMARALFGLNGKASGSVAVGGRRASSARVSPGTRLKQGLGYLSEDRKREGLALPLSVADNLTVTGFASVSRGGGWIDLRRQRVRAEELVRALGVRARTATQAVRTLSGGNQQKVALGRLVHQDAAILLLDEPTRGIDIGSKAQVYETIAAAAAAGKAVLLISSYLPELFGMCDRLGVMTRGRLSEARPISEWTPETVLAAAIGAAAPTAGNQ